MSVDIQQNLKVLAKQVLGENTEIIQYDPENHDKVPNVMEQLEILTTESGQSIEYLYLFTDACRLRAFAKNQSLSMQQCLDDEASDKRLVSLIRVLEHSQGTTYRLFQSRTFLTRWSQKLYRPWLYLLAHFTYVIFLQSWDKDNVLTIHSFAISSALIPEWFNVSPPILLRNYHGEQLNPNQASVIYMMCGDSMVPVVLTLLNRATLDQDNKYVIFVNLPDYEIWKQFLRLERIELKGYTNQPLLAVHRELTSENYFSLLALTTLIRKNTLPGFSIGSSGYVDIKGRPILQSAPGPSTLHSLPSLPLLRDVPNNINWKR